MPCQRFWKYARYSREFLPCPTKNAPAAGHSAIYPTGLNRQIRLDSGENPQTRCRLDCQNQYNTELDTSQESADEINVRRFHQRFLKCYCAGHDPERAGRRLPSGPFFRRQVSKTESCFPSQRGGTGNSEGAPRKNGCFVKKCLPVAHKSPHYKYFLKHHRIIRCFIQNLQRKSLKTDRVCAFY